MPILMEQKSKNDVAIKHSSSIVDDTIEKTSIEHNDNNVDNVDNSNFLVWILIILGLLILGGVAYWYYQ